jgi:hypothetical protein
LSNIAYAYDAKVDWNGNIYVPDFNNGRVLKWTPPSSSGSLVAGQISSPGSSSNRLNQPSHVILDSAENIYVCDYSEYLISVPFRSLMYVLTKKLFDEIQ